MKSQFTNEQIVAVMEERGINRKSALKFLNRNSKDLVNVSGRKAAVAAAQDVKMAAANDRPEPTKAAKVAAPKPAPKPTTDAGKARSAGVQNFILAGRPTKDQFIAVYGEAGPRLTWDQRAALGIDAAHFQKALKAGKCVAPVQQ
jgi:hypothetical protein